MNEYFIKYKIKNIEKIDIIDAKTAKDAIKKLTDYWIKFAEKREENKYKYIINLEILDIKKV